MSLDPEIMYEKCATCEGKGKYLERECPICDGEGVVPHSCKAEETTQLDPMGQLVHDDDQLRAQMFRDSEIAGYMRASLMHHGFSEQGAERVSDTYLDSLIYRRQHADE